MGTIEKLRRRAGEFNNEIYALYLAYKDPRTPLYAKVFAALVAGYALSPIDFDPRPYPAFGVSGRCDTAPPGRHPGEAHDPRRGPLRVQGPGAGDGAEG